MNKSDAQKIVGALRRSELDVVALGRLLDYLLNTVHNDRHLNVIDDSPRRPDTHSNERWCDAPHIQGTPWLCERQAGHDGAHMAWEDYDTRTLYEGGRW